VIFIRRKDSKLKKSKVRQPGQMIAEPVLKITDFAIGANENKIKNLLRVSKNRAAGVRRH
jgi:hypothetical protein